MMILEHSIREDSHRAMRRSHASVMHPDATPASAKASLKQHGITQHDLKKNPLFVEMWIDRFPEDGAWLAFLANAVAFITEATFPWDWRQVVEKTLHHMNPSRQAAWENDPQTAMWRFYSYTESMSISALSFADLSAEVWRADVPVSALYEVADRILCGDQETSSVAKPAMAFALYTHGARCFYRDVPIADLVDDEVTDETRAFLYWGWKSHALLGMSRDKGLPKKEMLPHDLLQILRGNTTVCLEVLEHTFGEDDGADEQLAPLLCLSNTPRSKAKSIAAALRSALPETEAAANTAEGLTGSTLELYRIVRQMLLPSTSPAMPLPDRINAPG